MAGRSRIRPSTTNPTMPRWRAFIEIVSPSTALTVDELASMTSTSPGWARSSALWTIRLSPGNTFTVQAGPTMRRSGAVIGRMSVLIVYKRFSRSEISGVSNAWNPVTMSGAGLRSLNRNRNPGPGCNFVCPGFAPGGILASCVSDKARLSDRLRSRELRAEYGHGPSSARSSRWDLSSSTAERTC